MSYDTSQYLLDRANIQDVVSKMAMYVDKRDFRGLVSDVFAEQVILDYSLVFGAPAQQISAEAQASEFEKMLLPYPASSHMVGNFVIELPQPGNSTAPDAVKVACAYTVALTKQSPRLAGQNSFAFSAGRYEVEVRRIQGKVGNPWRLSSYKVYSTGAIGDKNAAPEHPRAE